MELSEERLVQWLKHFDLNREHNCQPIQIHASGYAGGPELLQFARAIRPKTVVPIHTEHPEVFVEELKGFCQVWVPREGEALEL